MNTFEKNKKLKNYKCFIGTFARDQLPYKLPKYKTIALIMNTDPITSQGEHWVAIFIKDEKANYFDSFGFPPLHQEFTSSLI